MKKYLIVVGYFILLLAFTACNSNNKNVEMLHEVVLEQDSLQREPKGSYLDENEEVFLEIKNETYSLKDKEVSYTIVNHSGETLQVVLVPNLEIETDSGWEQVKCDTGFCGTADSLDNQIDSTILLEWYPNLLEGKYRLSFKVEESKEGHMIQKVISDEFTLIQ